MKYEIESNGKFQLGSFFEGRYLLHASVFKKGTDGWDIEYNRRHK